MRRPTSQKKEEQKPTEGGIFASGTIAKREHFSVNTALDKKRGPPNDLPGEAARREQPV